MNLYKLLYFFVQYTYTTFQRSPATRLRLREGSLDENGDPSPQSTNMRQIEWAVDDLYIGHQCKGLCSGHGRCTKQGCMLVSNNYFLAILIIRVDIICSKSS